MGNAKSILMFKELCKALDHSIDSMKTIDWCTEQYIGVGEGLSWLARSGATVRFYKIRNLGATLSKVPQHYFQLLRPLLRAFQCSCLGNMKCWWYVYIECAPVCWIPNEGVKAILSSQFVVWNKLSMRVQTQVFHFHIPVFHKDCLFLKRFVS